MNNQVFIFMNHNLATGVQGNYFTLCSRIAIVLMIIFLIIIINTLYRRKYKSEMGGKYTKNYKAVGLSDNDIVIFRETMGEAKQNIEKWETTSKKYIDISVIEDVTGGLSAAKKTFRYIVKNPREATRQADFLYKQLPNIVRLAETFEVLKKETTNSDKDESEILLLMKTLSANISKSYRKLLMRDVEVIGKEIENG